MRRVSCRYHASSVLLLCGLAAGCSGSDDPQPKIAGDPSRGRELIQHYGCGSCHVIPKVTQAKGQVGPPLTAIAKRTYLGGVLPNTPENMSRWIREPQKVDPRTAMPDVGVSEADARDISAFLYTLK